MKNSKENLFQLYFGLDKFTIQDAIELSKQLGVLFLALLVASLLS
jgi:hypothetical protein